MWEVRELNAHSLGCYAFRATQLTGEIEMDKFISGLVAVGLVTVGVAIAPPASAGTLSGGGITLTWDDSRFFVPNGCSSYPFTVQTDGQVNVGNVVIVSQFGDKLGSSVFFDSYTARQPQLSQETVQVCGRPDQSQPMNVIVQIDAAKFGGTSVLVEGPLVLQPRQVPAAKPTSVEPPQPEGKSIRCINKKTFKKKTFQGVEKCPKGWIKI